MRKTVKLLAGTLCAVVAISGNLCFTKSIVRADGIAIDATNFPDANFREYVCKWIDDDKDETLSSVELENTKEIYISDLGISDLTGIEYFTSLSILKCFRNQLISLDVSKNTELTELYLSSNCLTSLDVSKNTRLRVLACHSNQLTSLDVSKNSELSSLECQHNKLSTLDLSKNPKLRFFSCEDNQLSSLDVSNNPELGIIYCGNNQIKTLDLSKNPELGGTN